MTAPYELERFRRAVVARGELETPAQMKTRLDHAWPHLLAAAGRIPVGPAEDYTDPGGPHRPTRYIRSVWAMPAAEDPHIRAQIEAQAQRLPIDGVVAVDDATVSTHLSRSAQ